MKSAIAAIALLLTPALAFAQAGQPANALDDDPIGALLSQQETTDVEPAEDVAEDAAAAVLPAAPRPYAPRPYVPPANPAVDRPVMIHETGVSPDGPPDLSQLTYESRVRGSIAAAQGLQGPLDGAWALTDASGTRLYALQMVDPISGVGLEGAWRDPRRGAGIGGVGLIDSVERVGGTLTLRFYPRPGETVVAELSPTPGGGWSGRLSEQGVATAVTLVREGPAPAGYSTVGAASYAAPRPYDPTVRAAPRAAPAKAPIKKKAPAKKKAPVKRKRA